MCEASLWRRRAKIYRILFNWFFFTAILLLLLFTFTLLYMRMQNRNYQTHSHTQNIMKKQKMRIQMKKIFLFPFSLWQRCLFWIWKQECGNSCPDRIFISLSWTHCVDSIYSFELCNQHMNRNCLMSGNGFFTQNCIHKYTVCERNALNKWILKLRMLSTQLS